MRPFKALMIAALALPAAACVETVDSGYQGVAYAPAYSEGYYARPVYTRPVVVDTVVRTPPRVIEAPRRVEVRHEETRHEETRKVDRNTHNDHDRDHDRDRRG